MARTFSIRSEQIARYLGTAFINAARIVIVSPWVSDITVKFPETDQIDNRELLLSQTVNQLDVNVTFVVLCRSARRRRYNHVISVESEETEYCDI